MFLNYAQNYISVFILLEGGYYRQSSYTKR